MEDDLEAELLAVTSNATNQKAEDDEDELSENFYSGDSESEIGEVEEFDEKLEGNREEGESDEEFVPNKKKGPSGKRNKRHSKSNRHDKASPSSSPSSKRPRPSAHGKKSSRKSRRGEEQRTFYEDGYDEYGFGDDKDVARLMSLGEVEREAILAERLERREQLKLEKDIKRRIGEQVEGGSPDTEGSRLNERPRRESERTKKKRAALESLAMRKGKQRGRYSHEEDISFSDESSDGSSFYSEDISEGEELFHTTDRRQQKKDMEERRRPISYRDIVDESCRTTPLFLRRQMLEMFISKPFFDRMIVGMFARLSVGAAPDNPNVPVYRLVRIAGVHEREPRYKVGGIYTNKRIVCLFGSIKGEFSIERFSNKHPTEAEFDRWFKQMMDDRETIPTKEDVDYLISLSLEYRKGNIQVSDEELQKHIEKFEKLNPERINYVAKKNEILTQITFLRDNGASEGEIAEYERKLAEIERLEAKYHRRRVEDTLDDRLKSLAKKSKEENARIDSEKHERQGSRDRSSAELNPFSRRTSRGTTSYFTIERKGSEVDLSQPSLKNEENSKGIAAIDTALKIVSHPKEESFEHMNPAEFAQRVDVSLDDLFDDKNP